MALAQARARSSRQTDSQAGSVTAMSKARNEFEFPGGWVGGCNQNKKNLNGSSLCKSN
jgi:hypothetical protein